MKKSQAVEVLKLTVDTTEYEKVLDRVKTDLASLGAALGAGIKAEPADPE